MQQSIINESVLEQIVRQERQALQMVAMKPKDRPEYLRSTAASRQSMSQSGLFRLERIIPKNDCCDWDNG